MEEVQGCREHHYYCITLSAFKSMNRDRDLLTYDATPPLDYNRCKRRFLESAVYGTVW